MPSDEARAATERALSSIRGSGRRERQQIEILRVALGGDLRRARGLGAEHLAEFPDDSLIRHVVDGVE